MTEERVRLVLRYTFPLVVWRIACTRYAHSPEHVREAWAATQVRAGRLHGFDYPRNR